ncbi:DUF6153 family protein [Streptomyces solicathayae]|uniref:DUF6153 family protein n=1 Tax=Streptomyces solicathayae TaxID=3081768 RepID=A0ABZ0LX46_9ACTN|nr:DUF6153 family protein [Streptomyces sp. HUAS YS2]WOX24004.1 DUF6153 family protein [Streptomyces sp. HUAS YS2]
MTSTRRPTSRRPLGGGFVMLVLVVLAGVLGMHALSPAQVAAPVSAPAQVGMASAGHGTASAGHGTASAGHGTASAGHGMRGMPGTASAAHSVESPDPEHACSHGSGGSGHLEHADATCAAAGVGGSYAPPAPAPAGDDVPPAAPSLVTAPASAVSGRAPPDLAELQLLRI